MAKHKMVSLMRSRSESKAEEIPDSPQEAFFPLSLFVNGPELEKLGLTSARIGDEHELRANVKVTSVSVSENEGSEKHQSVELTLIEGEVGSDHVPDPDAQAKKMFGEP